MAEIEPGQFHRWQGIAIAQFGTTASLVLGLAVGLLAFQADALLDKKFTSGTSLCFARGSVVLLGGSVVFAIWCAINRLRDFRLTAQIARQKTTASGELTSLREKVTCLGEASWRLLWWQLALFVLGAASCGASVLIQTFQR